MATVALVSPTAEAAMKRPPKPTRRPRRSPGWTVRRCLHGVTDLPKTVMLPLTPEALGLERDEELDEQLRQLYLLELSNLRDGADVRREAYAIARRPELQLRLEQSDELVETAPGHVRLRTKRRRGILRHLTNEPDLATLPLFPPPPPILPKSGEWRDVQLGLHLGRLI